MIKDYTTQKTRKENNLCKIIFNSFDCRFNRNNVIVGGLYYKSAIHMAKQEKYRLAVILDSNV